MFYKESFGHDLYLAVYDPTYSKWVANYNCRQMIGGESLQADRTVGLAVWNNVLNLVWKKAGGDTIHSAVWDGTKWTGGQQVMFVGQTSWPTTLESPALALFGEQLVMVHKSRDSDDLHWEVCDAGGNWTGGDRIAVVDHPDDPNPGTSDRPALAVYNGVLYLLYKSRGTKSTDLYVSTFDGTSWRGNRKLDILEPKIHTHSGPGIATYQDDLYVFFRYDDSGNQNVIRYVIFNGSLWSNMQKISIDPLSSRIPWPAAVDSNLMLFYKGQVKTDLYEATYSPS
jgi:hypothetical protein